ncbi:MAG TPA: hypothetical protein VF396_24360, partial [Bradyrhizobium sp.]
MLYFFEVVVPTRASGRAQGARPSFQADLRSDRKPARTSSEKSFGCSQAAKMSAFIELVVMDELGIR